MPTLTGLPETRLDLVDAEGLTYGLGLHVDELVEVELHVGVDVEFSEGTRVLRCGARQLRCGELALQHRMRRECASVASRRASVAHRGTWRNDVGRRGTQGGPPGEKERCHRSIWRPPMGGTFFGR